MAGKSFSLSVISAPKAKTVVAVDRNQLFTNEQTLLYLDFARPI